MRNNNKSENSIGHVTPLLIMLAIGIYFFIPTTTTKKKPITQNIFELQNTEIIAPIQKLVQGFDKNFTPKYYPIADSEENLSKHVNHPLFAQDIYIQVGLSEEELRKNLIHAAWSFQKIKNGADVWIYAYRVDDAKRNGGYSAGYCSLPQYKKWANPEEKRILSFFNSNIAVDTIYFKNTPRYKITQQVIINTNSTKLFQDSDCNYNKFLTILNKGTKAIVVDRLRSFIRGGRSFAITFKDTYKIRVNLSKNNVLTGWVLGDVLDEGQDYTDRYETQKTKMTQRKTKRSKKK